MTAHPKAGKPCRAALLFSVGLSAACAQLPATDGARGPVEGIRAAFPEAVPTSAAPASAAWHIVDVRSGAPLSETDLNRRILATQVLLMGEQHDQPLHHQLRARWLRVWAKSAAPASPPGVLRRDGADFGPGAHAIVFEHLDREHDPALQTAQREQPDGPVGVWLESARFDGKAWGRALYQPLFDAAFNASREDGARWVAGNFSRESARAWMRTQMQGQGAAAGIDPALLAVRSQARWDEDAARALLAAVREGHCDALPDQALAPMVTMQRVRDAALAFSLRQVRGRALLLAGNGHVDRRFGVPRYLPGDAARLLVIGMENLPAQTEAKGAGQGRGGAAGAASPADVQEEPAAGAHAPMTTARVPGDALSRLVGETRAARLRAAYDIVVLTSPSAESKDHCAAFRARPHSLSGNAAGDSKDRQ